MELRKLGYGCTLCYVYKNGEGDGGEFLGRQGGTATSRTDSPGSRVQSPMSLI
jgi:hypothetical protein